MKAIKKFSIVSIVIALCSLPIIPLYAQTITDNCGHSHILKMSNGIPESRTYHELGTGEEFLHHKSLIPGDQINYWHARILHAGYNFASSGFPSPEADNYEDFVAIHGGTGPDWNDGFIVHDGHDPDNSGDPHNSGAAIFRADDYIVLSDGFKVVYNPAARANNTTAHSVTGWTTSNTGQYTITVPNHGFWNDLIVRHEGLTPTSQNDIKPNSFHYQGPFSWGDCQLDWWDDYKITVVDADHYTISYPNDASVVGPLNATGTSGGSAKSVQVPDNAYFHAYTGDRFSCSTLWASEDINDDFTQLTSLPAANYEEIDACKGAGGNYNPANVILHTLEPTTSTFALDLKVTDDDYSCTGCSAPHKSYDGLPGHEPILLRSAGGIWSNDNCVKCTAPRYSLLYGAVEFTAKLDAVTGYKPALWSYHNVDDTYSNRSDEIDVVDHDGPWFEWTWADGWGVGKVVTITVVNGGTGYSLAPTVSFSGGGGAGATATAIVSNGVVTQIDITNGGGCYTSTPTIVLTGDGSGATATSTISNDGEDEVYHYLAGNFAKVPYADANNEYGGGRTFFVDFMQLPGNSSTAGGANGWKSFSDDFHTFRYEWLPGEVRYLVDGVEVGRSTRHVPGDGMNIWASNQMRENVSNSHLYLTSIKARPLNPSNECGIANKKGTEKPVEQHLVNVSNLSIGNIIPNPAQDKISFDVVAPEKIGETLPIRIELFNALGQLEAILFDAQATMPSKHSYPVHRLSSGSYYIRVSCGNTKATKSFVIQR